MARLPFALARAQLVSQGEGAASLTPASALVSIVRTCTHSHRLSTEYSRP